MIKKAFLFLLIGLGLTLSCDKINDDSDENTNSDNDNNTQYLLKPENASITGCEESIEINWNLVHDAETYAIYWTDDDTEPSVSSNKIDNIVVNTYSHLNLDYSKLYKYKIQAVNGSTVSPFSEMVSGSPIQGELPAPTGLGITENSSSISLSWNSVNGEAIEYKIYRCRSTRSNPSDLIAENLTNTQYSDYGIEVGKGYKYAVTAYEPESERESDLSYIVYGATTKIIYESERNNSSDVNSLTYDTDYYGAESVTIGLDKFRIKGGYNGQYSMYNAYYYKNIERDCFKLDLSVRDEVCFRLISGDMGGLWEMNVSVHYLYGASSTDGQLYSFRSPSDNYTFLTSQSYSGIYLSIGMWDDLINYGPYNYEIEITIIRN